jgi:hypothetical protein
MMRVIRRSIRSGGDSQFVVSVSDASRQYVTHEYDASDAQRISMYANILPPIGLFGATTGLFVLSLQPAAARPGETGVNVPTASAAL